MSREGVNHHSARVRGEDLLRQLREGWAPLPTRTLFALAMGGLRVRMMRSAVTMLSIVLAIAFLTYTGITNKLAYQLALGVQNREKSVGAPVKNVAVAAKTLVAHDLYASMPIDQQRQLGREFGMADVSKEAIELQTIKQQARTANLAFESAKAAVEKIGKDPKASAADRTEAQAKFEQARVENEKRKGIYETAKIKVELGQWLASEAGGDAEMPKRLHDRLARHASDLVLLMNSPARYTSEQIEQLRRILDLYDAAGLKPQTAVMREALAQEMDKRITSELKTSLRKAGVSVEATLAGNPMDAWLITMAMLTCAVGIANAMLMSVTERFREIGTMKCLGAQDTLVVKLFLLESGVLGVVGALIGIVLGILVAVLAALLQFSTFGLSYFPLTQSLGVIGLSVLGGIVLAVVGAVYPAFAASRMRPVDALRVDE